MNAFYAQTLESGAVVAVLSGKEKEMTDAGSALELAMRARYELGADALAIDKRTVEERFFILSSGLAGEVLQKWVNYQVKAAFYGDFTCYTSKPLRDFMGESNKGGQFFFVATLEEALQRLDAAR